MHTKLLELDWNNDTALFPGLRSTESSDPTIPWLCISEVIPGIFLTCEERLSNRMVALELGIALIINLCAEEHVAPYKVYECEEATQCPKYRKINGITAFVEELDRYTEVTAPYAVKNRKVFLCNIAAIDAPNYEIDRHFPETCALIELVMANRAKIVQGEPNTSCVPSVGVHCMVGVSRSASVVLAYLMKVTGVGRDDALSFVQSTRAVVNPNPGFQQQLALWQATSSKRIFDDFSAELVANEVQKKGCVVDYVQSQLPALLRYNKCSGERQYFGYVIGKGLSSAVGEEVASAVYRELRSYVTAAVDNEVYADSPNFFGCVAEIASSLLRYTPALLFKSSLEAEANGFVWSDAFYFRVVKDIGRSGFVKDTYDTVRAFCSLLEAIHVKQHAEAPLSLLHREADGLRSTPAPPLIAISFPFTPFMAPYAEGFVQFSELETLQQEYPTQGLPLSLEMTAELTGKVARMFLSSFLVSTTGVCSSVSGGNDSPPPADADAEAGSRWCSTSRLLFLRKDVEVEVFERLLDSPIPTSVTVDKFLTLCANSANERVAQCVAKKVAAAVVSFRLVLETVDHFVRDAYSQRLPAEEDPNTTTSAATKGQSDTVYPLSHVRARLAAIASAYSAKWEKPCNLPQYFKAELEPLIQCEVVQTDGVWSLFQSS